MKTYPIPPSIEGQYQGAGYALAATTNGQIIRLVYLHDVLDDDEMPQEPHELNEVFDSQAVGRTIRELSALGEVSIGMASCWEFVEL